MTTHPNETACEKAKTAMMNHHRGWWWWTRGVVAVLLAALLVAFALPSAGRMVVDASTSPPTHRAVWGFWECFASVGPVAISLACILVSMWRRWDSEIIGWVLLVVLILGVVLGGTGARLGRPFRALGGVGAGPGAMPRAGLGRPVGAGNWRLSIHSLVTSSATTGLLRA